jgi:integrase
MATIVKHPPRKGSTRGRYRAMYRDAGGSQVSKVFDVRRDAQHWLDERTHERVTGRLGDRRAGRQTFRALWEEVHERRPYAPATRKLHERVWEYVKPIADRAVADVTPAVVAGVLRRVDRPVMKEKVRLTLSAVFAWAVAEGRIGLNPAATRRRGTTRAERPARPEERHRRLRPDDLGRVVAAVPERYRALVELMAWVGLRPGEAYALTVGQVGTKLTVDRSADGPTKTGETREIVLPAVAKTALDAHIVRWSDPTDPGAPVFTTGTGGRVRKDAFRHVLARACRRVGVEPVAPNDLRHTAAARAIEHGASVYAVQRMLGHAKPSITLDTYGYLWDRSAETLAENLDAAIRAERVR